MERGREEREENTPQVLVDDAMVVEKSIDNLRLVLHNVEICKDRSPIKSIFGASIQYILGPKSFSHVAHEFESLRYSQSLFRHRPVICSLCTIQLTILNKESGKPWYQHPHIGIKLVSIWTHVSYPPNSVEKFRAPHRTSPPARVPSTQFSDCACYNCLVLCHRHRESCHI